MARHKKTKTSKKKKTPKPFEVGDKVLAQGFPGKPGKAGWANITKLFLNAEGKECQSLQFESKFGGKFIEEFHGERGKNIKGWDECKEKMRLKSEYYFISSSLTSEDEGGKEEEQPSQPPQSSKKDDGKNDESKKQRSTSTLPTPTSPELEAEPKTNATHAEMVEFDIGEKVFAEVGMGKTDDWYFGEITAKGNTAEDGRLYYAIRFQNGQTVEQYFPSPHTMKSEHNCTDAERALDKEEDKPPTGDAQLSSEGESSSDEENDDDYDYDSKESDGDDGDDDDDEEEEEEEQQNQSAGKEEEEEHQNESVDDSKKRTSESSLSSQNEQALTSRKKQKKLSPQQEVTGEDEEDGQPTKIEGKKTNGQEQEKIKANDANAQQQQDLQEQDDGKKDETEQAKKNGLPPEFNTNEELHEYIKKQFLDDREEKVWSVLLEFGPLTHHQIMRKLHCIAFSFKNMRYDYYLNHIVELGYAEEFTDPGCDAAKVQLTDKAFVDRQAYENPEPAQEEEEEEEEEEDDDDDSEVLREEDFVLLESGSKQELRNSLEPFESLENSEEVTGDKTSTKPDESLENNESTSSGKTASKLDESLKRNQKDTGTKKGALQETSTPTPEARQRVEMSDAKENALRGTRSRSPESKTRGTKRKSRTLAHVSAEKAKKQKRQQSQKTTESDNDDEAAPTKKKTPEQAAKTNTGNYLSKQRAAKTPESVRKCPPRAASAPLSSTPATTSANNETGVLKRKRLPFGILWMMLERLDESQQWTKIKAPSSKELFDWYYIRPGCSHKTGTLGKDYFTNPDDVVDWYMKNDVEIELSSDEDDRDGDDNGNKSGTTSMSACPRGKAKKPCRRKEEEDEDSESDDDIGPTIPPRTDHEIQEEDRKLISSLYDKNGAKNKTILVVVGNDMDMPVIVPVEIDRYEHPYHFFEHGNRKVKLDLQEETRKNPRVRAFGNGTMLYVVSAPSQVKTKSKRYSYGQNAVHRIIAVKFKQGWYTGKVTSYNPDLDSHTVVFHDGHREKRLDLCLLHRNNELQWNIMMPAMRVS